MSKNKLSADDFIKDKNIRYILKSGLVNNVNYSGIHNSNTYEIKTNYEAGAGETIVSSNANAFIVLGRDRPAGISSGQGGKGYTGASCIDIIAGHGGPRPVDSISGQPVFTGKDFKNDAARVYISQMTDVDEYFEIPKIQASLGDVRVDLEQSVGLSTVAAKADTIRMIARENIKLVTFHKGFTSANFRSYNGGIDIVAGCNVMQADPNMDLQPMVKGNNLIELLKEIVVRIDDVQSTVVNFMEKQRQINDIFSRHTHQSNKAGLATSNIIGQEASLKNFTLLTDILPTMIQNYILNASIDATYFTPFSAKYINSIWNRVN